MEKPYHKKGNESHISELPYMLFPEITPPGVVKDPDNGGTAGKLEQDTTGDAARMRGWSKQNKLR